MNARHALRLGALAALTLCALHAPPARAWGDGSAAQYFSSHPMISGTVAAVNDRQMVVNTDQGEQVTLEMDARTMAFRDLAPGLPVRVDFAAHEHCRLYAERVWAVRVGTPTTREQAYANTRYDGDPRRKNAAGALRDASPMTTEAPSPGMVMSAITSTGAYAQSTRPMVSGRVVTANDHLLIVDTEQGQRVGVVMDSHTMVPGDVGPGAMIRAEFKQMNDSRYLATSIHSVPATAAEREQAYAHTRDRNLALDPSTTDCGVSGMALRESAPRPAPPAPPAPAPPPPPAPAAPPANPAPTRTERALIETGTIRLDNVFFETAKARLLPESEQTLNEAGAVLEKHPELKVEVGGHTDSRGSKAMNVQLSQARAEAVRAYLLEHFKIAPGNLTAKGYGPPASGKVETTDAERQANRRVELRVVK